jgi:ribonuclease P protein component
MTLPPEARIRRRTDYLRVQRGAVRVSAPHFVFLLTATPSAEPRNKAASGAGPRARLGIIASKQLGNAIVRARAKRLTRAAFRAVCGQFPAGLDLVVLVRGDIMPLKLHDVLTEWISVQPAILRRGAAVLSGASPVHASSTAKEPTNRGTGAASARPRGPTVASPSKRPDHAPRTEAHKPSPGKKRPS